MGITGNSFEMSNLVDFSTNFKIVENIAEVIFVIFGYIIYGIKFYGVYIKELYLLVILRKNMK
ncbi:MAG: hypothetical protein Ta2D_13960 [Rickettsiales bacterium]|nr:MAG: hypothetical protein Ta2D_13960 [Rickettsiales bacterium]